MLEIKNLVVQIEDNRILNGLNLTVKDGEVAAIMRERSAFRAAWPYGLGVTEHEPKGKAAQEVAMLLKFVLDEVNNCTPARVKA